MTVCLFSGMQQDGFHLSHASIDQDGVTNMIVDSSLQACTGHMEGNAGITGLLLPIFSLEQNVHSPIVHLKTINKYIQDLFGTHGHVGCIKRSAAPNLNGSPDSTDACATSSFGMSGVNAHALCQPKRPRIQSLRLDQNTKGYRTTFWPTDNPGVMLTGVVQGALPRFQCRLHHEALSSARQHHVHGQAILAGSFALELFLEAVFCIHMKGRVSNLGLQDVSFLKPVNMHPGAELEISAGQGSKLQLRDTASSLVFNQCHISTINYFPTTNSISTHKTRHIFRVSETTKPARLGFASAANGSSNRKDWCVFL